MADKRMFTTPYGAKVEISESNYITTDIVLGVAAIIDHDFEGFLDLVSLAATNSDILSDISYTVKAVTPDGNIIFEVTGDITDILGEDD
jgi:hypothetical protein